MAYDEDLAARMRVELASRNDVTERKMFGGIAFMVAGNMCCGVAGDDLMLRLGADGAEAALDEPHTRPMDFTGRPLTGYVFVAPGGTAGSDIAAWVARAVQFALTLTPKA